MVFISVDPLFVVWCNSVSVTVPYVIQGSAQLKLSNCDPEARSAVVLSEGERCAEQSRLNRLLAALEL